MKQRRFSVFNRVPPKRKFYSLSQDESIAELLIYDEISFWGIDAQSFVTELQQVDTDVINVRINSPGGSVFDGLAIFNALRAHPARVDTFVDGVAASIASVIALAGSTVSVAENSFFMIHNPWAIALGDAKELRSVADNLDKVSGSLERTYVNASEMTIDEVKAAMDAETWYDAEESVEVGFADQITDTSKLDAKFDLSMYEHAPDSVNAAGAMPNNVRDFERFLRDAGYSRNDAKAIAGHGFGNQRDADDPALERHVASLSERLREIAR